MKLSNMFKKIKIVIPPGKICMFSQDGNPKNIRIIESSVFCFYKLPWQNCFWYVVDTKEQNVVSSVLEAFTSENLDVKYNYSFSLKIFDPKVILERFGSSDISGYDVVTERVRNYILGFTNELSKIPFSTTSIKDVTKNKSEISNKISEQVSERILNEKLPVILSNFTLNTIMLPTAIQKLIASEVENEMKSKMELEAARTKVAIARTLKNAADLLRGDEVSMELKKLEVLEKIGQKGKTQIIFKMNNDHS